jgi:O-6-methylguanine DNA methyltransferase
MINVYHTRFDGLSYGVAIKDEKIVATAFAVSDTETVKEILRSLPFNEQFTVEATPTRLADRVFDVMKAMFDGEGLSWDFELEQTRLSSYARKVLNCLSRVPLGYVTTYGALAKVAGGGPRAVGQIMKLNPFAPIIPCHRVIKSDFSIGGYGGSLTEVKLKRTLIEREDKGFDKPSQVKTEWGQLQLFPVAYLKRE